MGTTAVLDTAAGSLDIVATARTVPAAGIAVPDIIDASYHAAVRFPYAGPLRIISTTLTLSATEITVTDIMDTFNAAILFSYAGFLWILSTA